MLSEINIKTSKPQEIIDITAKVQERIKDSSIKNGTCLVYVPHATAGILINENYDPKVCEDILDILEKLIPSNQKYKHDCIDNNAHSHIKAAIIGPSETIIIKDRELVLGTWQNIGLCEFDGPKTRKIFIKIIQG